MDRSGDGFAVLRHGPARPGRSRDAGPVLVHVNAAFAQRLRDPPAALTGTCPLFLSLESHEPGARDAILSAMARDGTVAVEVWIDPTRAGARLSVVEGLPLGETGDGYRLYGLVVRDVPAGAIEARLRDAIESLNDAFMLLDPQDRVVLYNHRFLEIYPELTPFLHTGVHMRDLSAAAIEVGLFPESAGREDVFLRERMDRFHNPGSPFEHRIGDDRWVRIAETRTPDGWTVSVRTDITAEKQTEQRLREEALRAEESSRAKSRFLSAMSHELRTPLNLILGFSDILRRPEGKQPDPRQVGFAEDIHTAGSYLLELINDILDMSKIEAGKYELRIGGVAVYRLIEDTARMVRQKARDSGLELQLDLAPDLPGRIRADGRALRQVLLNLLSNAIKFTRTGGSIIIRARSCEGWIEIAVVDTGIGIAPENLPRLAQPFEQIDSALNRRHQGSGLGLALSKSLIELHGGRLRIESEPKRGTTVAVTLPVTLDT